MRLYLPATLDELDALRGGRLDLQPRRAHAATPALVRALADEGVEDLEEVEYLAQMFAADDSLVTIAGAPSVPWLRLVLSVDVPDGAVGPVSGGRDSADDEPPLSAVEIREAVTGVLVVCAHVDEPEAATDVQAVMAGDEAAMERLTERDLLWYDTSELGSIPRS